MKDSHVVMPGSLFPLCGGEPNDNVTLALGQIPDPDVLDAAEVCEACLVAAKSRMRGPVKR